ncbi:MAG: D-alanine-D-alanine ligase [Acidimicrobiaceae bacterium]|nr:D-alanine-D-alanine ligase [Acidimicrobiaceae bacterium]
MSQPAVIFGGPSPEHDVSILTGLQAARALGGQAIAVYWAKTGDFFEVDPTLEGKDFLDGVPRKSPQLQLVAGEGLVKRKRLDISAAVNCCHGGPGEDGTLQAALDLALVRYTGPNVAAAALGMDKLAFGNVMSAAGLPSLARVALRGDADPPFDGPYIVKPRFGGSSIGISVVEDADTARALLASDQHLRAGAVVEPYRPDAADLNVAVRSWPSLQLSAIEKPVRQAGSGILGYKDKYVGGEGMVSARRELPARLDPAMEKAVRDAAERVAVLAGVRGVARIDFLVDGDDLYVNEINTIPGSLAKYLWVDPPLPFEQLLQDMLDEAARRPTFHWTTAGADGTALRSAGDIAGKLG